MPYAIIARVDGWCRMEGWCHVGRLPETSTRKEERASTRHAKAPRRANGKGAAQEEATRDHCGVYVVCALGLGRQWAARWLGATVGEMMAAAPATKGYALDWPVD